MENVKNKKLAIAILAILLVSSIAMISNLAFDTASAQDYGDLLQYDWPQEGQNSGNTKFSAGPAPDRPDVLWSVTGYGSVVAAIDGKVLTASGSTIYALDAFTGEEIWAASAGGSSISQIDDDYFVVETAKGCETHRLSDGELVWESIDFFVEVGNPGGGHYHQGPYSTETEMLYQSGYEIDVSHRGMIVAWDLSDPTSGSEAWRYVCDEPTEILAFGDGKVFCGTTQYHVFALDGETGELLWTARKIGFSAYWGTYYDGRLWASGASTRLTCYNATNGDILWDYDSVPRGFFAHSCAVAYGMVFQQSARPDPTGYVGCWDVETGEVLWQTKAWIRYGTVPAVADGKLYYNRVDTGGGIGSEIAGVDVGEQTFACYDVFTGEVIWEIPLSGTPVIAYGNLYLGGGRDIATLYCLSTYTSSASWSYFRGNLDNPGVAVGQSAPVNIGAGPTWTYATDDAITSSPVIVDGKVYIGSNDKNLYCIDAYTGEKIWNFTTDYKVSATPFVVGGRVYTGATDGNVYCLDADDGTLIWERYAGGWTDVLFEATSWQPRSSPIVIGNKLYVGALDGKVYCLSTSDGDVEWTYQTNASIGGYPAYDNGMIYIPSTDRTFYALDATTGDCIWTWDDPKSRADRKEYFFFGTPTVAEGKVFIGGGGRSLRPSGVIMVALNATTGEEVWIVDTDPDGNSNQAFAATYHNGILYMSEHNGASARNATTGELIWWQWLGFQVYSSAAYADDVGGAKVYYGCDSYGINCLNATDGKPLSTYTTGAQVPSSPAIYEGRLYVGSGDGNLYCFEDKTTVATTIFADSNKGATMWNNETLEICGKLSPSNAYTEEGANYGSYPANGYPNATVILSVTKADGTDDSLTTTTDNRGEFSFSYTPTDVGDWGWVVYYDGEEKSWITYASAYGEWNSVSVTSPTASGDTEPPPEGGVPMEYVYAAVAVIVIVLAVVGIYVFMKSRK